MSGSCIEFGAARLFWLAEMTLLGLGAFGLLVKNRKARGKSLGIADLSELGRALQTSLRIDDILRLIYRQISSAMDVSTMYIARYNSVSRELTFDYIVEEGKPLSSFSVPESGDMGLAGWILRAKKPLLIRDLEKEEDLLPGKPLSLGRPTRSFLGVPLLSDGKVLGVLSVQSYTPNAFTEESLELLTLIGTQVSAALENASLYRSAKAQAAKLAAFSNLAEFTANQSEPGPLLSSVLTELDGVVGFPMGAIYLYDPAEDRLDMAAFKGFMDGMALGQEYEKWVIANRRPLVIPEAQVVREEDPKSLLLVPITFENRCKGVISLVRPADSPFTHNDLKVAGVFANQAAVALENARLQDEIRNAVMGTVGVLIKMIEVKDPSTRGHSERVTKYALAFAEKHGLPEREMELLRLAALLHDIGKVSVPGRILTKPGPLTESERSAIRCHPERGVEILKPVESLEGILSIIYHHHERFDGKGYPEGLKGDKIPFGARVLAVADAVEAMRSDRPYRKALPKQAIVAELESGMGAQFDPDIAAIFLELLEEGSL